MTLHLNQTAPAFCLLDQTGVKHCLKDYLDQWLLLYFYPKDDTPGCTTEACALRDCWEEFVKAKLAVIGISIDSATSHTKFANKYRLPFTLLADTDKTVVKQYGVWAEKKFMGKTYLGTDRVSFLINPQGKIAKIYSVVKPDKHAVEVLADWEKMEKKK